MFSTLVTVALFVSLAIQGTYAGFAINTPHLAQCTPGKVSWAATKGPYNLQVVLAGDPCGDALKDISIPDGITTYNLTLDLKPGTEVELYITDSVGNEAWSGKITIGGDSSACTPSTSSSTPPPANVNNEPPPTSPTPTPSTVPNLGGAINAGSSSSGMLTVHRASTSLLLTALAALLALTL